MFILRLILFVFFFLSGVMRGDASSHEHGEEEKVLPPSLKLLVANSGWIRQYRSLPGKVVLNPEVSSHINPRYSGIVRKVYKKLGDRVKKGDPLALIESDVAIQRYLIRSSIKGEVIFKDLSVGEFVGTERLIFSLSNLDSVWVSLIFRERDRGLFANRKVLISDRRGKRKALAELFYVSPMLDFKNRTAEALLRLENRDRIWKPGQLVDGYFEVGKKKYDLVVRREAVHLQGRDFMLYVQTDKGVEKRKVLLGDQDLERVEIRKGIAQGEKYLVGPLREVAVFASQNRKKGHSHEHEGEEKEGEENHAH